MEGHIERADDGELWTGVSHSDIELDHEEGTGGNDYFAGYEFVISEHTEVDAETDETVEEPEAKYLFVGGMVWIDGGWKVNEFSMGPSEGDV